MIKRKLKDALRETKIKIHGVPFIHRVTENKFDSVETWVRADGHGMIRKTDDGRFGARYEMWNDIAKKYETRVIEPKDEIEEVVDQMTEDITEGERKKKAREEARKRMMGDAKADGKFVIMHPKKNLYLTAGGKTWSEEDDPMIKKFNSETDAEAYAKKNTTNFRITVLDAKADGKAVWVMREDEDFWRPWGLRDWTEDDLEGYRDEFKEKGYKKVILVENDGTDPNKVTVHDDYGWEIPASKAWDAFESVKKIMGAQKLLLSLEFAMGTDDVKEATKDIAADWNEETEDIDELVELAGEDEVLDAIAQWLSFDDLADDLAFICRMNDIQIPELVDEEEIEVDEDVDVDDAQTKFTQFKITYRTYDGSEQTAIVDATSEEEARKEFMSRFSSKMKVKRILKIEPVKDWYLTINQIDTDEGLNVDDALWAQPDNDAGSAGILTKERPIKYKDYLILTREDGMFDVYTRRDFDLVGTEFKTVEEAKKNIDEGRKDNHIKTEVDEDFDKDEELVEVDETEENVKPDPDAKIVNYGGYRIMKQKDGSWTIIKGGLDLESRKPIKTAKNFAEAVKWLYKTDAKIPFPGNATKSERLIAEYLPAEFKDSANAVTNGDIKIGLAFAYSINPNKHFEVVGNTATDAKVIVKNPKGELEIMATEDLVHDINNGDLILVSKGE